MKHLLLGLLLFCVGVPQAFAGLGSFLVTKTVYLYAGADPQAEKTLTRRVRAYPVTAIKQGKGDDLMLQIEVPSSNNLVQGVGFIVETDEELAAKAGGQVKVYSEVPNVQVGLDNYQFIDAGDLLATGREEKSKQFPALNFRAVNYKTTLPKRYWVFDWGGIYRPDKDAAWLNQIHPQVASLKTAQERKTKILNGLVEPGFTLAEVRLALGEPVKEGPAETPGQLQWEYQSRRIIFEAGKVVRQAQ